MLQRDDLIKALVKDTMSEFARSEEAEKKAAQAFDMGVLYAETKKFDNSRYYHNYQFCLDDGGRVSSSSFFNQFMTRTQTYAYMEAERVVKNYFDDEKEVLFHMVRDKRNGINGVFKAVMSPDEPQQLNRADYVLVIAAFCSGVISAGSNR